VLADGTNRYLYAMGRIAQQTPNGLQYFLPDALGSARQLTGVAGALALVQSFDPYGGLLASQGSAATPYGFTGEWGDASGLLYLRARYYLPQAGIFTTRDPFPGFTTLPVTLQPYLYAAGNPLRYTDPSGRFIFLALLGVAAVGGLVGGALYGYGSQVIRNLNQNHFCLRNALTTQIDVNTIGFYAVTGLILGTGIGVIGIGTQALMGYFSAQTIIGAASTAACGDGDCSNEVVNLYRSVSESEFYDILQNQIFQPKLGGGSMEAKWFWEGLKSAQVWVSKYSDLTRIVKVQVPKSVLDLGYKAANIDNLGPAVAFMDDALDAFNRTIITISEVIVH
jgi:RHS repeat-associated protein